MKKQRAVCNRTLSMSACEVEAYARRCIEASEAMDVERIKNTVLHADAFVAMHALPAQFADLMIADPPYNLNKCYDGAAFHQMSEADYEQYTHEWITAAKRLLKPAASVYVCCDWKTSMIMGNVLKKHFIVRNRITWQREKGRGAARNWKNGLEDIWFATMSGEYTFNVEAVKMRRRVLAPYKEDGRPKDWQHTASGDFRDTHPSNFWDDISIPYWSMPENTDHPAQKPEKLIAKLILASSNEGDMVFDPFLGSGTSAVVAKKLQRAYMGIEISKEYCALAQKRLEMAQAAAIQGYAGGVFWERNTYAQQKALSALHPK